MMKLLNILIILIILGCSSVYVVSDSKDRKVAIYTGNIKLKNLEYYIDTKTQKVVPTADKNILSFMWQRETGLSFQSGIAGLVQIDSLLITIGDSTAVFKRGDSGNYTITKYLKKGRIAHSTIDYPLEMEYFKKIAFSKGVIVENFFRRDGISYKSLSIFKKSTFNRIQSFFWKISDNELDNARK